MFGAIALISALAAILIANLMLRRLTALSSGTSAAAGDPVFVIEGEDLTETNFEARRIIASHGPGQQITHLRTWLSRRFDGVADLTSPSDETGDMHAVSRDGTLEVSRQTISGATRLIIRRLSDQRDISILQAEDLAELATLRANTGLSPFPLWRTNAAGEIVWMNEAYIEAGRFRFGAEAMRAWPIPHLFEDLSAHGAIRPGTTRRLALRSTRSDKTRWFDCSVLDVEGDLLFTAMNVDEIVVAENRLREVTQTLTKTFANLTIGLAVFDRKRNLTLFNPALTELTSLSVEFLASRPALPLFLDALREERMMPEPRDYKGWRDDLMQIESGAAEGTFEETWAMPGGQTWRVTGRPHPDGAIAILFEDISLEMSLTRRFRKELDQGQEILDALDHAVAVFGIEGTLTHSNAAYRRLWHPDDPGAVEGQSVVEATRCWLGATSPTPVWGDFRDFATETRDRHEWTADARLNDGRALHCRFTPLANGATLARFEARSATRTLTGEEMRTAV